MIWAFEGEKPKRKTRAEQLAAIPDDVRDAASRHLHSSQLIAWIMESIECCGVAGEQVTALLVYLTGTSRLLKKPLAIIIQGASSSGKSYLLERVTDLFPADAVLIATDITAQALYYMEPGELSHRFVLAGERPRGLKEETGQGTKALREMISAGKLSKVVTISNGQGHESKRIDQRGPIAYAESTTATNLYEEDANRCLILQSDERPEQTERILLAHGLRCAGLDVDLDRQERIDVMQALQWLLEPLPVVIPFAPQLVAKFPKEPLEVRRSIGHVTSVIETLALLHQYQRERDDCGRIIARPEDYALAKRLLDDILARSLGGKDSNALQHFVQQLRLVSGEFTAKELAKLLKISERTIRDHLEALVERSLVEVTTEHHGRTPKRWLIRAGMTLSHASTPILPSLEDVCGVDESTLDLPELSAETFPADISDVPF